MNGFPKVRLIAVGKIKKQWVNEGIEMYHKRIPELTITEIKDSTLEKEADQVVSLLKPNDQLILLTEEGRPSNSVDFAHNLAHAESQSLIFFIGSADGISSQLKVNCAEKLSLSLMTFPHEIARLLFVEQLYRAKTILQGRHYHKA